MIFYGNNDKIVTNWGEIFGDLHELVIIKVMQISLYLVKTLLTILSLFVPSNFAIFGGICRNWWKLRDDEITVFGENVCDIFVKNCFTQYGDFLGELKEFVGIKVIIGTFGEDNVKPAFSKQTANTHFPNTYSHPTQIFLFYSLGTSVTIISDVAHRALKNTTAMITLR